MNGWWFQPLWNILSIGMMTFPIYGEKKHVPNHQPDEISMVHCHKSQLISPITQVSRQRSSKRFRDWRHWSPFSFTGWPKIPGHSFSMGKIHGRSTQNMADFRLTFYWNLQIISNRDVSSWFINSILDQSQKYDPWKLEICRLRP